MGRGPIFLLALAVVAVGATTERPGVARAVPAATAEAPPAAACRVEPLSLDVVQRQAATPTDAFDGPGGPLAPDATPRALPEGEPADAATAAGVRAAVRELVACTNARDGLRRFALLTERYRGPYFALLGSLGDVEAVYRDLAAPEPRPREELAILIEVEDVRLFPDGRARARVIVLDPTDGLTPSRDVFVFVASGDRWLLDEVFEDAG